MFPANYATDNAMHLSFFRENDMSEDICTTTVNLEARSTIFLVRAVERISFFQEERGFFVITLRSTYVFHLSSRLAVFPGKKGRESSLSASSFPSDWR